MSNALRKKRKILKPLGYNNMSLEMDRKEAILKADHKNIINNVQFTLRNLTFYLLYWKFGFEKRKLGNFHKYMDEYDIKHWGNTDAMWETVKKLKEQTHIDLQEYVRKIPVKEKAKLAGAVEFRNSDEIHIMTFSVRTGYISYLAAVLIILKQRYRFSEIKLKEFLNHMHFHINCFCTDVFTDEMVMECLEEETGYHLLK